MLLPEHIETVQATAPLLADRALDITRHFYRRLFERHPEVVPMFNAANQRDDAQQRALADAVVAFALNIRQLENLGPAVERIAHKHVSLGAQPEHFPVVGENLLAAIQEVLGEVATSDVLEAWGAAYGLLSGVLIDREAKIREDQERDYGWSGFRSLAVIERTDESDCITSFVFADPGGEKLGSPQPGQYLTLQVPTPEGGTTMRHYSLSRWGDLSTFRISVKREPGSPVGHVSNWLHDHLQVGDQVQVAPPAGHFFLDVDQDPLDRGPLVLLSGGVGVTPILAMMHYVTEASMDRQVLFLHAARKESAHAFGEEVRALAQRHGRTQTHVRYSHDPSGSCDSHGFVDEAWLSSQLRDGNADVYLCGPAPFMAAAMAALREIGVPAERIQFEAFGPLTALPKPAKV